MLDVGGATWDDIAKMTFYVPDLKLRDLDQRALGRALPGRQLASGSAHPARGRWRQLHQLRLRGLRRVTERSGGQILVEGLRRWGVDVVFGLPGVQLDGLYEGFALEPSIRVIHTRHEQATSYMADGYRAGHGPRGRVCRGAGAGGAQRGRGVGDRLRVREPCAVHRRPGADG